MPLISFGNHTPDSAAIFCAPDAWLIGQVSVGTGSSIWFGSVLRGDVEPISVGQNTNLQDGCILHGTSGVAGVTMGNDITVGHGAILHACTVQDRVLIGMRATVLDRVCIQSDVILAAGGLVPPGKTLESGWLYAGSPARPLRKLTDNDYQMIRNSAQHYRTHSQQYANREVCQ